MATSDPGANLRHEHRGRPRGCATQEGGTMKAVVFQAPKKVSVENEPDPELEHPRDAIVRVTATAICGSDLHIYNGAFPQVGSLVLGHEFMGIVEEVGSEVRNLQPG